MSNRIRLADTNMFTRVTELKPKLTSIFGFHMSGLSIYLCDFTIYAPFPSFSKVGIVIGTNPHSLYSLGSKMTAFGCLYR